MAEREQTRFINVDLDVRAKTDLAELVPAFEPGAYVLGCTKVKGGYFGNSWAAVRIPRTKPSPQAPQNPSIPVAAQGRHPAKRRDVPVRSGAAAAARRGRR